MCGKEWKDVSRNAGRVMMRPDSSIGGCAADSPLLHPWWPLEPPSSLASPYSEAELRIDYDPGATDTS